MTRERWATDNGQRAVSSGQLTAGSGQQQADIRQWAADSRQRMQTEEKTEDSGQRSAVSEQRTTSSGRLGLWQDLSTTRARSAEALSGIKCHSGVLESGMRVLIDLRMKLAEEIGF